ncbi:MAG TPA: hypothetical protein VNO53_06390 [Steroidobacteraceae bacterium]|nr:hypothetical protein [Steroidobacteraceae bacterium]
MGESMSGKDRQWTIAASAFVLAVATFWAGVVMAAQFFPDAPFDWMYRVVSELASRKHNPQGGYWFSIALGLSMLALLPVVSCLQKTVGERRWPIVALRAGVLFGVVVGVERLVFVRLSSIVDNGHEALAVGAFAGLYVGMLGLYWQRVRLGRTGALVVAAPLAAIFITQILIYFDQRDLGWVDHGWREMGVSPWLSFAFWQWLAVAFLWFGLGHLLWSSRYAGSPIGVPAKLEVSAASDG